MLDEWLAPMDLATFKRSNLEQQQPHARPGTARNTVGLFQWATLERVLRSPLPLDLVTVSGGRLVEAPSPRSLADVRTLMDRGVSVVIRGSERHDRGLAELARQFATVLPGDVHVQLYVTPGATNSYGWHYDFEDVFIVQTLGVKDYYFRANSVAPAPGLGQVLDFQCVRRETTPIFSSRLLAGDWLYIPRRWWHLVKCLDDALSISIGVMPPRR